MTTKTSWQKAKQYRYLPEHLLSRLLGKLASANCGFASQCAMKKFSNHYKIDFKDVEHPDLSHYKNFNDFFTRALKPGARPIVSGKNNIASPVDGKVYIKHKLVKDIHIEAKGAHFTLNELLGGDCELAQNFSGGDFTTIYLAPKDYHRIHMPFKIGRASCRERV